MMHVPSTGSAFIDRSHLFLAQRVERVAALWRMAAPVEEILSELASFRQQVAGHFQQEEVILRGIAYDRLDRHQREHGEILQRIDGLLTRLRPPLGADRGYELVETLERILFEHELVDDAAYKEALARAAAGQEGDLIRWSDELAVGLGQVDDHHQALAAMLNRLHRAGQRGAPKDEVLALLSEIRRAAVLHFQQEEELIDQGSAEGIEHALCHRRLLADMDRMIADYRDDCSDIAESVAEYVKFWLLDHISGFDRREFSSRAGPC